MKKLFPLLSLVVVTGCSQLQLVTPTGEKFTRTTFGQKTSIPLLIYKDGERQIELRGYKSDQVEALGVVAEGVARGLK